MIVDIHTHITYGKYPQFSKLVDQNRKDFPVKALLKEMDSDGIDISVLLPLVNPENDGYFGVAGNIECLEAARKYPERLVSFCNIDPRCMLNTPKADLGKLMRIYKDLGCRGIGEICANLPLESPLYDNLFRHAAEEDMPILFHFTGQAGGTYGAIDAMHFPALQKLLKKYPHAKVIGHAMAFWNEIDGDMKESDRETYPKNQIKKKGYLFTMMDKHPNIYGDISAGSCYNALSRTPEVGHSFLKRFNKKLFFGTDRFTPKTPSPILNFMKEALKNKKLTKNEYDNIMYKNFKRIFTGETK
ncbi:MAG: hypothetical protein A2020_14915 [Lentisphaerae bacterium GWF2_45_14]|nr:MAG: hypothetical protein A2020_14915 [Lentisphaerae bacterium GWF2_45_14]